MGSALMMRRPIRLSASCTDPQRLHSGEIMVCLVINGKDIPAKEQLVEELCQVKGMTSISYSINQEKTNVIMGKRS